MDCMKDRGNWIKKISRCRALHDIIFLLSTNHVFKLRFRSLSFLKLPSAWLFGSDLSKKYALKKRVAFTKHDYWGNFRIFFCFPGFSNWWMCVCLHIAWACRQHQCSYSWQGKELLWQAVDVVNESRTLGADEYDMQLHYIPVAAFS